MRTRRSSVGDKNPSLGNLTDESRNAVGKLLSRSNNRSAARKKKSDNNWQQWDSRTMIQPNSGSKGNDKDGVDLRAKPAVLEAEGCSRLAEGATLEEDKVTEGNLKGPITENKDEMSDSDWEDGSIPVLGSAKNQEVTIEFKETPDSAKRKPVSRATAEEKEVAEMVHKVHLLCLLGRGRLIDKACDDPLIQAVLLSLLPRHLLNISDVANLTAKDLNPLFVWFRDKFHVKSHDNEETSFHSALASALETREGNSDEIAALSVALFRALGLTTRFVSILDAASLKPEGDKCNFGPDMSRSIFSTLTPMVTKQHDNSVSPIKSVSSKKVDHVCETSKRSSSRKRSLRSTQSKDSPAVFGVKDEQSCLLASETNQDSSEKSRGPKRRGDIEFELQMDMALSSSAVRSATDADSQQKSTTNNSDTDLSNFPSPLKRLKRIITEESTSSNGVSTAIGSRRLGFPLYWAEVYCCGENLTGKWVHVDAVNAIIDGEQKVEAMAAACKTSLRYVVAFSGNGAKDVTRRYCMQWYKIVSKRVNPVWWDEVMVPLKELESKSTSGIFQIDDGNFNARNSSNKAKNHNGSSSRSFIEDMELETRALTEPLPTNQQAYRTHPLYAIEKWLTKNQVLHPKGPILGFCSGHPVYPRTCVETLKTRERWLREALQVKANELPVKEVKVSTKLQKVKSFGDDDYAASNSEATVELFGKWQLEPLQLPHAVNGKVPKNERGRVDVWSEKCLPHGTVHLRFPRISQTAKRLEIDYASAMVGFEFKNGQSYPVFEGIVVCAEFKEIILEAYIEEQKRRETEEKRRSETQAIARWYQLLSSIVTRQRINSRYGEGSSSLPSTVEPTDHLADPQNRKEGVDLQKAKVSDEKKTRVQLSAEVDEDHRHMFVLEEQEHCSDNENYVPRKRCHCGLVVQAEDL